MELFFLEWLANTWQLIGIFKPEQNTISTGKECCLKRVRVLQTLRKSVLLTLLVSLIYPPNARCFTDVCHQPTGKTDLTASDVIDQLRRIQGQERWSTEKEELLPRRTYSLANLPRYTPYYPLVAHITLFDYLFLAKHNGK